MATGQKDKIETFNIIPPDLGEKERVLQLASKDLVTFGQLFLAEDFMKSKPAPFHHELGDTLLNEVNKRICAIVPRGHAKAQSLDSKVLTPSGWKRIGDLCEGDYVIGSDGKRTMVTQLHPISKMDLYRVTTRDGRSALCNEDHLWTVTCPQNTGDKKITKTTRELIENYETSRVDKRDGVERLEYKFFLHTCKPIKFSERNFELDPYTLGAWLGDGNSAGGRFTTADREILSFFPYSVSDNSQKYNYGILGIRKHLVSLNVLNNKHIPEEYLFGSIAQREALLQGLIDTDGYISSDGMQFGFCNKNKRIIDGVVALIRSLGGTVSVGEQLTRFDKNSEYKHSYRLTARLPDGIVPVRLGRKLSKWNGSLKTKSAIVDISYEKNDFGRCITVENEDGLYITDDYMVTHNSTYVKAALLHKLFFNAEGKREFIAFVSEEQSQAIDHLKYIKSHIEFNPALNYYFGDIAGKKWTEKEITTSKGDRIISKGTTQRLRGRSELGLRYTKIVLDDFESELNTKTPERRMEIKEWVMSTVIPALEESKGNEGSVWLIGTIVHYDSFLQSIYDGYLNAQENEEAYTWEVVFHRAMEDGKVLWPDYFSKAKLQEIKRGYIEQGLTHKFAQEYMNDARDLDSAKFKIDRINYYDGQFVSKNNQAYVLTKQDAIPINVYMGVDLAYESTAKNDYQVIMVVGVDSDKNFYVLEYFREHFPLYDMPRKIFEFARSYQPLRRANVEHVGAQGVIKDAVNNLSGKDRKMAPGIARGVRPPTGIKKEDRIEALLCPLVNRKKLFVKKQHQELIDEMFHFPKGKNDDLLDGLWYSVVNARSPVSHKFDASDFENEVDNRREKLTRTVLRNWVTGQRF